jgi:Fungal chitosanase of glycosyl hydrolase group 75
MRASIGWSTAMLAAGALVGAAGCNAISGIGKFDFQGAGGAGQGGQGATVSASSGSSSSSSAGGSGGVGGSGGESCVPGVAGPTAASLIALVAKSKQVVTGYDNGYNQNNKTLSIREIGGAYLWESGMSIDCDGKSGAPCSSLNPMPDPETALHTSKGEPLDPIHLQFAVLPGSGCKLFDLDKNGVLPGSVMVVINEKNNKVEYGVAGDVGACESLGSASYLMADRLGIDPDPETGGTPDKVLYIVFKGPCATVDKPEDHQEATDRGEALAAKLVEAAP